MEINEEGGKKTQALDIHKFCFLARKASCHRQEKMREKEREGEII